MIFSILLLSCVAQALAALVALGQIRATARFGLAWACVSLALTLMVERRLLPLLRHLQGFEQNAMDATFGLGISLLMLVGIWGIRRLFTELQAQDEQLKVLASTDALTGLANRRETLERLRAEFERSQRSHRPLSVLMLDLDFFKAINDTWGHAAGDAVLRAVGEVCRANLRRIDLAGRWGGEEFLVLMPETDTAEAMAAGERLRTAISSLAVADAGTGTVLRITASIGVATSEAEMPPETLIAHADAALYAAKQSGRNRIAGRP